MNNPPPSRIPNEQPTMPAMRAKDTMQASREAAAAPATTIPTPGQTQFQATPAVRTPSPGGSDTSSSTGFKRPSNWNINAPEWRLEDGRGGSALHEKTEATLHPKEGVTSPSRTKGRFWQAVDSEESFTPGVPAGEAVKPVPDTAREAAAAAKATTGPAIPLHSNANHQASGGVGGDDNTWSLEKMHRPIAQSATPSTAKPVEEPQAIQASVSEVKATSVASSVVQLKPAEGTGHDDPRRRSSLSMSVSVAATRSVQESAPKEPSSPDRQATAKAPYAEEMGIEFPSATTRIPTRNRPHVVQHSRRAEGMDSVGQMESRPARTDRPVVRTKSQGVPPIVGGSRPTATTAPSTPAVDSKPASHRMEGSSWGNQEPESKITTTPASAAISTTTAAPAASATAPPPPATTTQNEPVAKSAHVPFADSNPGALTESSNVSALWAEEVPTALTKSINSYDRPVQPRPPAPQTQQPRSNILSVSALTSPSLQTAELVTPDENNANCILIVDEVKGL